MKLLFFCSMKSKERVLLGMSGGTDSSVAAMKLQEAGYEVTGVTFRFYEVGGKTESIWKMRGRWQDGWVLSILHTMQGHLFRERIIRYFIDEYLAGHTPFPVPSANNELKWKLLAEIADEKGIYWYFDRTLRT